jgi:hypothetical protein
MTTDIHVAASIATPTTTGVEGAMDVDVTVTIDGKEHDGEVTLVRSEQDGRWVSWGQPDHWVSSKLLASLQALPHHEFRSALNAIEEAASESCD